MSKFSRLLCQGTSCLLVIVLQLPVASAFLENSKTGTVLTESGSAVLEEEKIEQIKETDSLILETNSDSVVPVESSTGELVLEENFSTGAILIPAEEEKSEEQKNPERAQLTRFSFKNKNLDLEEKERIEQKLIRLTETDYAAEIQAKVQNFKNEQKSVKQNLRQGVQNLKLNRQAENFNSFTKEKNTLAEINAELKTNLENALAEILTEAERAEIEIEPNYLFEIQETGTGTFVSNDPEYENQWGISSILSQSGRGLISTENAYAPLVALIDTGVDYNHEDLEGQFWSNENCVDDFGEAISEGCLYGGYDFVDEDTDPYASDNYAHGTQVAGILAAKTNNELGIASLSGITPLEGDTGGVQIMSLRVAEDGILEQEKIIRAIYFAVNNGADIINMSFGGPTYSANLKEAIEYAQEQGVVVFAAAGNYANNNDVTPIYPASYDLSNIVSVAAHDENDALASFSDYGVSSVDIAAPGVNILTTGLSDSYVTVSGTSFATPFVVGAYVYYVNVVKSFLSEL